MMWSGGMFLGGILWLVMIVGGGLLIAFILGSKRRGSGHGTDSSMEILKERYARGEISREEFEQRRKTLLSA